MDSVHIPYSAPPQSVVHDLCMAKKKPDPVAIECGRRLAGVREARGLTQAELARLTRTKLQRGLSPSQIANFEQGTRRIRLEQAEILAGVFPDLLAGYFMNALTEYDCRVLLAIRVKDEPLPKIG